MNIFSKNISIKSKIFFTVVVSALVPIVIILTVSGGVLLKSYLQIETEETTRNLERADDAITNMVEQLDIKLRDWSSWDDTYEFVEDKNVDYMEANLKNDALANIEINAMVFVDSEGEIVFIKAIELQNREEIPSGNIASYITSHRTLTTHINEESSTSGIILLPEGPFVIVSRPILTTESNGPINGALIFGKFLDSELVASIGELTHLSIEIVSYDSTSLSDDIRNAKNELAKGEEYVIQTLSSNSIAAYKILYDLDSTPILILKVDMPRQVYNQGLQTLSLFVVIASASILIFGVLVLIFFEKMIIARLTRLQKEVGIIGTAHDPSMRVTEGTADELGRVASAINKMFSALVASEKLEKEARESAIVAEEDLKKRFVEIENMNQMMVNRELKMAELKKEIAVLKEEKQQKGV